MFLNLNFHLLREIFGSARKRIFLSNVFQLIPVIVLQRLDIICKDRRNLF